MIRAYLLSTGSDGNTHVQQGSVEEGRLMRALSIQFREDPPYSSSGFHNAPTSQFVLSLSGVMLVETRTHETCTVHPGEVLIAGDNTGTGHSWKLLDDAPWRRAYIAFHQDEELPFTAEGA